MKTKTSSEMPEKRKQEQTPTLPRAGLRGELLKSDDLAEVKLFAATFLSGAASGLTGEGENYLWQPDGTVIAKRAARRCAAGF